MPIYEYRCTSCGRTMEVIQKMNDAPLKKCTECSGRLEKLISRSAFLLKGGGWYSEGYGGGSESSGSGSSSEPSTPSSSGTTSKPKKNTGDASSDPSKTKKAASGGGCGSGTCGCH